MQRHATRDASSHRRSARADDRRRRRIRTDDDDEAWEEDDSDGNSSGSSRRSFPSRPRGRLLFTQPIALTSAQMDSPALLDALMRRSRAEGEGQMLLLRPPDSHQFPPASSVRPSPHSHLFLLPNIYSPCARASDSACERAGALMRQGGDADDAVDVQYLQWQRSRRRQEQCTLKKAQQRAGENAAEADLKHPGERSDASAASTLNVRAAESDAAAAASASCVPPTAGPIPLDAVESLASELYVSASPTLDQSLPPLFLSLPRELRQLDDPLAIRAFIEKQNARTPDSNAQSSARSAKKVSAIADADEEGSNEPYTPMLFDPTSGVAISSSVLQLESSVANSSDSDADVEAPPHPDPDPNAADGLIRYAKNVGYVSLVAAAGNSADPFAAADPVAHLRSAPIHPLSADNLLGVMSRELAERRERRVERRRRKAASVSGADAASAPSPSSGSSSSSDSSDSDLDDDFALDSSASAGGILAPTLYCGSRGSITSIHAENDQFASFHQISAAIKLWYSVAATRTNRAKVMKLMRQLNSANGVRQENPDDLDAGLRSHAFFFDPHTLCQLGMDVHCTIQTTTDSLVLTSGALHQVINLTAVEGWSVNWLPPSMISTVAEVRQERRDGWRWSYPESVSLASLCWKAAIMIPAQQQQHASAASTASTPADVSPSLQLECARALLPLLQAELDDRARLDELRIVPIGLQSTSAVRVGSRKRVVAAIDLTYDATDEPALPFQLPLSVQSPPRTYPELCAHCENLSFFSAVFSRPLEEGAESVHLCCTACMLKYLRMRSDMEMEDSEYDGAASSARSSSDSSQSVSSSYTPKRSRVDSTLAGPVMRESSFVPSAAAVAAPSPPSDWSSAGLLPTAEQRATLFRSKFEADLRQRRRLWRRAILCQRVTVQMAHDAVSELSLQIGETQGHEAQENEELEG